MNSRILVHRCTEILNLTTRSFSSSSTTINSHLLSYNTFIPKLQRYCTTNNNNNNNNNNTEENNNYESYDNDIIEERNGVNKPQTGRGRLRNMYSNDNNTNNYNRKANSTTKPRFQYNKNNINYYYGEQTQSNNKPLPPRVQTSTNIAFIKLKEMNDTIQALSLKNISPKDAGIKIDNILNGETNEIAGLKELCNKLVHELTNKSSKYHNYPYSHYIIFPTIKYYIKVNDQAKVIFMVDWIVENNIKLIPSEFELITSFYEQNQVEDAEQIKLYDFIKSSVEKLQTSRGFVWEMKCLLIKGQVEEAVARYNTVKGDVSMYQSFVFQLATLIDNLPEININDFITEGLDQFPNYTISKQWFPALIFTILKAKEGFKIIQDLIERLLATGTLTIDTLDMILSQCFNHGLLKEARHIYDHFYHQISDGSTSLETIVLFERCALQKQDSENIIHWFDKLFNFNTPNISRGAMVKPHVLYHYTNHLLSLVEQGSEIDVQTRLDEVEKFMERNQVFTSSLLVYSEIAKDHNIFNLLYGFLTRLPTNRGKAVVIDGIILRYLRYGMYSQAMKWYGSKMVDFKLPGDNLIEYIFMKYHSGYLSAEETLKDKLPVFSEAMSTVLYDHWNNMKRCLGIKNSIDDNQKFENVYLNIRLQPYLFYIPRFLGPTQEGKFVELFMNNVEQETRPLLFKNVEQVVKSGDLDQMVQLAKQIIASPREPLSQHLIYLINSIGNTSIQAYMDTLNLLPQHHRAAIFNPTIIKRFIGHLKQAVGFIKSILPNELVKKNSFLLESYLWSLNQSNRFDLSKIIFKKWMDGKLHITLTQESLNNYINRAVNDRSLTKKELEIIMYRLPMNGFIEQAVLYNLIFNEEKYQEAYHYFINHNKTSLTIDLATDLFIRSEGPTIDLDKLNRYLNIPLPHNPEFYASYLEKLQDHYDGPQYISSIYYSNKDFIFQNLTTRLAKAIIGSLTDPVEIINFAKHYKPLRNYIDSQIYNAVMEANKVVQDSDIDTFLKSGKVFDYVHGHKKLIDVDSPEVVDYMIELFGIQDYITKMEQQKQDQQSEQLEQSK